MEYGITIKPKPWLHFLIYAKKEQELRLQRIIYSVILIQYQCPGSLVTYKHMFLFISGCLDFLSIQYTRWLAESMTFGCNVRRNVYITDQTRLKSYFIKFEHS